MNLNDIMRQAQEMQQKLQTEMKRAQEQLARAEVEGQAGAGMVKVRMTGQLAVIKVVIDPTLIGGDRELLEDLVAAAVNDAINRAQELSRQTMDPSKMGLPLPPGFKLPF
jgi:DNA-binding YbaB/EbfC family protein